MASPSVAEAIESSTNTAGTSHVVSLPTATNGQLLLIILDKGSTAATVNAHSELTELLDENLANGLYIAYRWMNGSEPSTYTLTTSANTRSARIAYRIANAENPSVQAPEIAAATASGSSATPDPPTSATPPSGSEDFLFIAFYGAAGEELDDDTWSDTPPSSYTPSPPRQKACGTAGTNLGGMIAAAERQLTTSSAQDPGTFAKDVSAAWRSQTIMVHPYTPVTTPQAIAATAVGVATLAKATIYVKELASTAIGVASLTRATVFSAVLSAVSVGTAALTKALTLSVSMAATAIGVATLSTVATFLSLLSAVATGIATLGTVFISGGGAPAVVKRIIGFLGGLGKIGRR